MAKKQDAQGQRFVVSAPVEGFNGMGAGGVQFAYGKAEVDEGWVLNWYREHGYSVEPIAEVSDRPDDPPT